MNRTFKCFSIAGLLLASGAAATTAQAGTHSIGGFAGKPNDPTYINDFTEQNMFDGVTNSSSINWLRWDMPMLIDAEEGNPAGYEVFVHVYRPSLNVHISCVAVGQNMDGGSVSTSATTPAYYQGYNTIA